MGIGSADQPQVCYRLPTSYVPPPRETPVRILIATEREARVIEPRLRALAWILGPMIELEVCFPSGRVLRLAGGATPAAQAQSFSERLDDALARQGSCGSR